MPQPIDPSTDLNRIAAAERVQEIAGRVSLVAQQRMAANAQEAVVLQETQTQEVDAKSGEVDAEAKRRNPYIGRRRVRGEQLAEEEHAPPYSGAELPTIPEEGEAPHFDVTI